MLVQVKFIAMIYKIKKMILESLVEYTCRMIILHVKKKY